MWSNWNQQRGAHTGAQWEEAHTAVRRRAMTVVPMRLQQISEGLAWSQNRYGMNGCVLSL